MSYEQMVFYRAVCDRCGHIDGDPCEDWWANRGNLDDHLEDCSGWYTHDGIHICRDCLSEDDAAYAPDVVTARPAGDLL